MDLDTENRIASILLKEAALRRQAQQEGVLAYLHKPTVRGRPNSRFLNATIRGIEQAIRVVEVNKMWRARHKELEMNNRSKCMRRDEGSRSSSRDTSSDSPRDRSKRYDPTCSSSKRSYDNQQFGEGSCLKDEELEEFLQSRVKRRRGSVGSRMDESGPYLLPLPGSDDQLCKNSIYFDNERGPSRFVWVLKGLPPPKRDTQTSTSLDLGMKRRRKRRNDICTKAAQGNRNGNVTCDPGLYNVSRQLC